MAAGGCSWPVVISSLPAGVAGALVGDSTSGCGFCDAWKWDRSSEFEGFLNCCWLGNGSGDAVWYVGFEIGGSDIEMFESDLALAEVLVELSIDGRIDDPELIPDGGDWDNCGFCWGCFSSSSGFFCGDEAGGSCICLSRALASALSSATKVT